MSAGGWSNRRVLVTGATGLVGAWLVKDLLARGAAVVALVRDQDPQSELFRSGDIQRVSVVSGALEDFFALERAVSEHETDTVFHLAAQPIVGVAHRFPLQSFESNVRGTYHVLEACRIHSALVRRVVVASSDKAYGASKQLPYTEDMPLAGSHPYEVSKSCADLIAQSYHHTFGMPVGIARCGNIFGGGDLNWSRIVPGTVRSFLNGERPVLRSDGGSIRDYIYVKDVVRAYMCLAEALDDTAIHGEAFNFSPESRITVLELVRSIQHEMKCDHLAPDVQNTARGEIASQYLSSEKAKRVLDWQPKYSLEQGLGETIEWYREYLK